MLEFKPTRPPRGRLARLGVVLDTRNASGRMSEIDLNTPNPGADNRPGALVFGSRFNNTYWREFGPRLGLAYQVNNKLVVRAGYAMTNTPPIANDWGYGGFTFGFNANDNVPAGTSPTGFVDDPAIYLKKPYPALQGSLPNTDPSQANYCCQVATTAKDANRPGYVQNYNLTVQYLLPRETVLEVAFIGNKGTRLWGAKGVFSEYDGLPASMLSMGAILNDSVSMHPQFKPYASFPDDLSVAQALTSSFATSDPNAARSRTARSASILRFMAIPRDFSDAMSWL